MPCMRPIRTNNNKARLLLLLVVLFLRGAAPALVGDEQFGQQQGGAFWTFHSRGVAIVNPETCRIEHRFDRDAQGDALPRIWSKGVYMQRATDSSSGGFADDDLPLTDTPELLPRQEGYVLINSGETPKGGGAKAEVLVLSTTVPDKTPVLRRIQVGAQLGNAYAVHNRNQFWTHSDKEGYFYVIDLTSEIKDHTGHPIKAKINTAHEGHLLWEMGINDQTLTLATSNIGYATSKGEPHLFIIDMLYHKQTDSYDFSNDAIQGTCKGAASMAYSKLNQHLYVQCAGPGGILEFDVSTPTAPLFITQHQHIGGKLKETPDQAYVTATDKGANVIHFFRPIKTGFPSTDPFRIMVKGHPETPSFYNHPETYDYIACMPLTQNTNQYHECDYWTACAPAKTQQDVQNGMCSYANQAQTALLKVSLDQRQDVEAQKQPWGQACQRCASADNYRNTHEECTCTPHCGSCASDSGYPTKVDDPLLRQTGVTCVDVKDALLGVVQQSDWIPGAGAIRQQPAAAATTEGGGGGGGGPICAFQEPVRAHKKGAKVYDASISTVPANELVIVDMRVQALQCRVALPGEPQQVIYVPTSYHYKSQNNQSLDSSAQKALIAILVVLVVVAILGLFVICRSRFRNKSSDNNLERQHADDEAAAKDIELTNGGGGGNDEENKESEDRLSPPSIDDVHDDDDDGGENWTRTTAEGEKKENGEHSVHSGHLA